MSESLDIEKLARAAEWRKGQDKLADMREMAMGVCNPEHKMHRLWQMRNELRKTEFFQDAEYILNFYFKIYGMGYDRPASWKKEGAK